jgi:hypothetical protein
VSHRTGDVLDPGSVVSRAEQHSTLVYSVPAADPDWECRASGGKGGRGVVLAGIEFASGLRHSAWESHQPSSLPGVAVTNHRTEREARKQNGGQGVLMAASRVGRR